MNLSRASLHALGAALVGAVVAAGLVLGVLPLMSEFTDSSAAAARTAAVNLEYERQIATLSGLRAEIADIDASVAALRQQIPAEPRLDDLFATVAEAARSAGTGIVTAVAGDTDLWGPGTVQIDFTVTVTAPTLAQAQQFLDALQGGPRLIAVRQATVDSGAHGYDLTVDAVAFAHPAG